MDYVSTSDTQLFRKISFKNLNKFRRVMLSMGLIENEDYYILE